MVQQQWAQAAVSTQEFQQLAGVLQQILAEQQAQRTRLDELGSCSGCRDRSADNPTNDSGSLSTGGAGSASGIRGWATTTFGALDQFAQAVQTLQGQIPDPTVAANQLNQLGQAMQDLQAQVQQQQQQQDSPAPIQQIGQAVQALQKQVQQMNQHAAAPAQSSASGPTPTPQTGDPGQAAQGNGLFQTGATVERSEEERNFSTLMVHQHRLEGLELVWAPQLPMRYNKVV